MGINFMTYYLVVIIQIDLKVKFSQVLLSYKILMLSILCCFYIICLDDTIFCKRAILK